MKLAASVFMFPNHDRETFTLNLIRARIEKALSLVMLDFAKLNKPNYRKSKIKTSALTCCYLFLLGLSTRRIEEERDEESYIRNRRDKD